MLTRGKQSIPYTMDGATSSKELVAIDRSNLTNNIWFPQEYLPGVSVSGRVAPRVYRAGVYSSGTANKEFGTFDGGTAALAVVGYDFAKSLGVIEALLAANYVHQTEDQDNTFTRQLENIVSVNFKLETRRWGGMLVTLVISFTGIIASLPLGILLALGRRSDLPVIRATSVVFIGNSEPQPTIEH